jgi:hypothetical protein
LVTATITALATRLLDRERGRRRRALARDKAVRAAHKTADAVDATARDASNGIRGVLATLAMLRTALTLDGARDVVLVERVRPKLGTVVPGYPELAMGAISSGGVRVMNEDVVRGLGIPEDAIQTVVQSEAAERR